MKESKKDILIAEQFGAGIQAKKMRWRKDGRLTSHLWGGSHEKYISQGDCCQIFPISPAFLPWFSIKSGSFISTGPLPF